MSIRVVCDVCREAQFRPAIIRDADGLPHIEVPAQWREIGATVGTVEYVYYACSEDCEASLLPNVRPFSGAPTETRGLLVACDVCKGNKFPGNRTEVRAHWKTTMERVKPVGCWSFRTAGELSR